MIRLTLSMFARSFRWLAPSLLVAVVSAIVLFLPGPPLDNLSVAFLVLAAAGVWISVSIGNLDGDAHREMLVARVGGAAALHARRAIASFIATAPYAMSKAWCASSPIRSRPGRSSARFAT